MEWFGLIYGNKMTNFFNSFKFAFQSIFEYSGFKAIYSLIVTAAIYLVGAENITLVNALMVLVAIDFITGISSAKIKGDTITSWKTARSAVKVVVYSLLISAAHLSEKIIPGELFFEVIVISFLALTEFISIMENAGRMGFAVPLKLLNKLEDLRDNK